MEKPPDGESKQRIEFLPISNDIALAVSTVHRICRRETGDGLEARIYDHLLGEWIATGTWAKKWLELAGLPPE